MDGLRHTLTIVTATPTEAVEVQEALSRIGLGYALRGMGVFASACLVDHDTDDDGEEEDGPGPGLGGTAGGRSR